MFDSVALKVLHQVVANLVILLGAQVMNLFVLRYLLVTRRDNLSDLSRDVAYCKMSVSTRIRFDGGRFTYSY